MKVVCEQKCSVLCEVIFFDNGCKVIYSKEDCGSIYTDRENDHVTDREE